MLGTKSGFPKSGAFAIPISFLVIPKAPQFKASYETPFGTTVWSMGDSTTVLHMRYVFLPTLGPTRTFLLCT
eukprot:5407566-Amphidinium_carterae.1